MKKCDYVICGGVLMNEDNEYCEKDAQWSYQSTTAESVHISRCNDHRFNASDMTHGLYLVGDPASTEAACMHALQATEDLIEAFWHCDGDEVRAWSMREHTDFLVRIARNTIGE